MFVRSAVLTHTQPRVDFSEKKTLFNVVLSGLQYMLHLMGQRRFDLLCVVILRVNLILEMPLFAVLINSCLYGHLYLNLTCVIM